MQVLMMPDYRADNPYQRLLAEGLEARGVAVHFPAGYRRGAPLWRAWRAAPRAKVLHLHWINPYLRGNNAVTQVAYCLRLLADVALLRSSGVAVVWTIHNHVSHESRWPRLERWVQRRLARQVDRFIVHARASLASLADLSLRAERVSIIPHGHYRGVYGPAVHSGAAREALGLPASGKIYLCFGMLRPYKGVEKLIAEWLSIARPAGDVLVIAGKPLDGAFLTRLTELASGDASIRIHGRFIPDKEVHLYFSAADLVVLPFSAILTSGSLLLAMSYGKPLIAPRFGSIVEMLGDADDLLYDQENPAGLRASLERSAALPLDSLRAKTERRCDGLDWGRLSEMTLGAYEQALEGRT